MNERLAVIIYDMQAGVVEQIPNGAEIVAAVWRVLDAARASGSSIFFTRHMWLPARAMGTGQLRRVLAWHPDATDPRTVPPPFKPGDAAWQIVPQLAPNEDEVVIDKITMSCFAGTFLEIALRDAGINAFAICGIALEIGIEPSVMHALDLNFIPIVVEDACGYRDEAAKRRCIEGFSFTGEVEVTSSHAFTARLGANEDLSWLQQPAAT